MNKKYLVEQIQNGGGVWESYGFKFTQEKEDGTIHVKWSVADGAIFSAFLMNHVGNDNLDQFYLTTNVDIADFNALIVAVKVLAKKLEVSVNFDGAKIIEREVVVSDNSARDKLMGKVEAYESMLHGRQVTVGK